LKDLAQFKEDLKYNITDLQPGLFRLDFASTCSVLGRNIVNKNQDGIKKLDRDIDHGGTDGGSWMSVADFLDGSLVKVDLCFEALLN
jgi:hypothetical protein